jgi:hypothetical protein
MRVAEARVEGQPWTNGRPCTGHCGRSASKVLLGMEYVVVAWQTGSLRFVLTICLNAAVTLSQGPVELLPFAKPD